MDESAYHPAQRIAKYSAHDELNDFQNFLNTILENPEHKQVVRDRIKHIQHTVKNI